ncbi:putative hydrolase [Allomuricauda ruestringensis DSM 13258]|uniref:Hydrolase n=1 Tax=Allomuricauda ruestringensis (strain DSM 13258 / CIP 107369 / LMG 19739 / B1) TaxID=886377 RepID=G2PMK9_ALLRU|nr:alpha/beta hydrolase-fold protein [Allomuricauda ruestringensis]AEM70116.1 putative hydrolase [Allomuricauda ruestringensis DSM 13258]
MKKCLFLLIGFICLNLGAQVKKEIFESFKLQERRDVSYYFPEDYTKEKTYPLIVVLDAEHLFDLVVANVKFQSRFDRMPEAIVVGVHQLQNDLRWEDCAYEDVSGLPTEKGKMFYEFLGTELIPYLETSYNIAPFKMFVGYDITANFGNYYLFKERSLFNSYISISPVMATEMESRVPARLSELNQVIFYNLIVEKQPSDDRQRILQMHNSINSITKESLRYFFDEYESADHTSIAAYGISKAFDNVFSIYRPITPAEYKSDILTSEEPVFNYLENRYQTIEDLFGFEKPVELNDIMAIYAACLKKEDYESLEPLADLCKKEYPDTMMGFYFEAEYYEFIGEPKKAFKTFEKAFQLEEIDFLTKDLALKKIDALKADFGY